LGTTIVSPILLSGRSSSTFVGFSSVTVSVDSSGAAVTASVSLLILSSMYILLDKETERSYSE
jgi:hypothetical protein